MQKINVETLEVELQLCKKWDDEITVTFKKIINASKKIFFTEELELSNHKLGMLTIETGGDKIFRINDTFLVMNKAAPISQFSQGKLQKP